MKQRIQEELKNIEATYGVKILYAVESGSRAWGFPSQDSDYDVRFIYVHQKDWYLSIDAKRDVIELPIDDSLDISGWELTKALRLFRKSNPPLLEWLSSGTVYYEAYSLAENMRRLKSRAFSPVSCMYHYLNMASGNFRHYLQREEVKIKKYFYVLRPILACQWIESRRTVPPIEFQVLLDELTEDGPLKTEIQQLLERKKKGEEFNLEPQNPILHAFIDRELEWLQTVAKAYKTDHEDLTQELDRLFRETLDEVWA
ncbi:nucleotidyltransferase domain-containing protein [Bacillus paralicheniformis]|uniref:nucleotidyltransferase domain-containing protein n=1 Tax=Bacillus paralicheniformis TaxID=1648923 RepID=UPI00227ED64B|nr:nucleotidyltransferase domain-containing protein [Bacillus paralicheniformis]MCY8037586.1 nucleotidyltransferase domain-containing protein [Bacillus paralicheniformis]MCY8149788.1 nucleotidyltransferase domain-containing protein [Bacillus paralicheniformis]MCY8181879.1 nucleotidyltransferase domain-containing protein [Bacillus paralicheniformis]MCY9419642.1 nucleotidyltransferase domain-containing protein [Bacillus paralicheniformis]MEC0578002.1 nucleotidyltransferase domain-containing prot